MGPFLPLFGQGCAKIRNFSISKTLAGVGVQEKGILTAVPGHKPDSGRKTRRIQDFKNDTRHGMSTTWTCL